MLQVATYPPNVKYQELFLKLQREDRENNRGLWAKETEETKIEDYYLAEPFEILTSRSMVTAAEGQKLAGKHGSGVGQ